MLRRILGRAELTEREVQTLRGILRKAEWKIGKRSNLTGRDVGAFVELKKEGKAGEVE
jgi:tRNA C32,U32 (ribose-2'-O)-methylase TrmJ